MRFRCIHCSAVVDSPDNSWGKKMICGNCNNLIKVPNGSLEPLVIIDDFILEKQLGQGGMGAVFLAKQISLDRNVALKILLKEYTQNSKFIKNFIREARATANLNHPNIVQGYAVGFSQEHEVYFIAMEYVKGKTLKQIMDNNEELSLQVKLNILYKVTEALKHAWNKAKLTHRDIKPDNIMINETDIKLMDLGLAEYGEDSSIEESNEILGTPQYVFPEILVGMPIDFRSDIYSLGATFYHIISGEFPFTGTTHMEIAKKQVEEEVSSFSEDKAPRSVFNIIQKMMEKHPNNRFQSHDELLQAIKVEQNKLNKGRSSSNQKVKSSPGRTLKKSTNVRLAPAKNVKKSKNVKLSSKNKGINQNNNIVQEKEKKDNTALIFSIVVFFALGMIILILVLTLN